MKSEHYTRAAMAPNSEGLLKTDQNMNTPRMDILVRESIQNSLDAFTEKTVRIDYTIGDYDTEILSRHLPELTDVLPKYPRRFMCIRDSGTTGLKGPVRITDIEGRDPGNYISLVKGMMDTSKGGSNAGGSWGIGKVIYYKIGINLVIYYSRIRTDTGFQSRMSAVWLDDGNRRFIPQGVRSEIWRGISLWGIVEHTTVLGANDVLPITDDTSVGRSEILDVLKSFGMEPFGDTVTGTAIIIPGLNEDLLMKEVRGNNESNRRWWTSNMEEYLTYSIQKWFSPRLQITEPDSPMLVPSVNGRLKIDLMPLFSKFQQLYNTALGNNTGMKSKNVIIRYKKNGSEISYDAGVLAWCIIPRSDLSIGSSFDNPFDLCDIERGDDDGNRGIITYTRSLGMFVTYDDPQLMKIPKVGEDAYLLAVFRLNPDTKYPTPIKGIETIENYIRAGEKSDHFVWTDQHSYNQVPLENTDVLRRIFNNIIKCLKDDVSNAENATLKGRRTTVGRKVADTLFPPGGHFVTNSNKPGNTSQTDSGGHKSSKKPRITEMDNFVATPVAEGVELETDIVFYDKSKTDLELSVYAPTTKKSVINGEGWGQEFGSDFPFEILSLEVLESSFGTAVQKENLKLTPDVKSAESGKISAKWRSPTKMQVSVGRRNVRIHVRLLVSRPENEMMPVLSIDRDDES